MWFISPNLETPPSLHVYLSLFLSLSLSSFQLKDEAVSLVDVLAPPDWMLGPLGQSDGNVRTCTRVCCNNYNYYN